MTTGLNNKKRIWKNAFKPCLLLAFCPYGALTKDFRRSAKRTKYACTVFGHECPVFYHAAPLVENAHCDSINRALDAFYCEMNEYLEKSAKKRRV